MFDTSRLRKNKLGSQPPWSKEELLAGLEYFFELNRRFPTAHEIDSFEYLPSSRSIQRSYGGLVKLRSELLPLEISNYTRGEYRSERAKRTYANGRDYERQFYELLLTKFEEIAVHEHKLIRPGDVSSDFFVYLKPDKGVVIDVFYADSIINLINVVNIKLKRYVLVTPETYLILVGNNQITQEEIDIKNANRRLTLPSHIYVITEEFFCESVLPDLESRSDYCKK
jgi:hypothetical protein